MVTLYVDEDFSYPVVQRLRQLGYDMLTAHEAGQADQGIEDAASWHSRPRLVEQC